MILSNIPNLDVFKSTHYRAVIYDGKVALLDFALTGGGLELSCPIILDPGKKYTIEIFPKYPNERS